MSSIGNRAGRLADIAADAGSQLVAFVIIGAGAVYPLVLAVQTGIWWVMLLTAAVVAGGAVAFVNAVWD